MQVEEACRPHANNAANVSTEAAHTICRVLGMLLHCTPGASSSCMITCCAWVPAWQQQPAHVPSNHRSSSTNHLGPLALQRSSLESKGMTICSRNHFWHRPLHRPLSCQVPLHLHCWYISMLHLVPRHLSLPTTQTAHQAPWPMGALHDLHSRRFSSLPPSPLPPPLDCAGGPFRWCRPRLHSGRAPSAQRAPSGTCSAGEQMSRCGVVPQLRKPTQ